MGRTIFAEFPLVASDTRALSTDTVSVTIAVRDFTLVMTHRALFALPAWIALAFTVDVVTAL